MKIISVLPIKKSILKADLTYFTNLDISAGDIVSVPIRNKEILALVTSSDELKDSKSNIKSMNFNLRKVTKNKGKSIFLDEFINTFFETSKYFAQKRNNTITSLIPNIFLEKYDEIAKFISSNAEPTKVGSAPKNIKSEKLLLQYKKQDRISIYKTLIRESFARGKSIFLVLPTKFDIKEFTDQLSKGIEQFTFFLHSGINTKKNLITIEKILSYTHPVLIIGTAPFLSTPRKDIGTIILEHENSNAYKTISRPYFDLRIFIEIYASKINAKFIMADELLRFETIGRAEIDNLIPFYPLSYRIDFDGEVEIIGQKIPAILPIENSVSRTTLLNKFKIFPDKSMEEVKFALKNKKSVFIFSLRKGLATETVCKDCGEEVSCKECGAPLVLYLSHQDKKRMFVCNKCVKEISSKIDGDTSCVSCGGWNLVPLGIGTDTVCEEIKKHFLQNNEKVKIFKLDKESAKTSSGAKKIIDEFEKNPGSILVGTEMAFFYLKNKVTLSVIASFNSLWSIPNFKMSERIIKIMLSTISYTTKKIIIQTKNENDTAVLAIKSGNLLSFVREELEDRKKFNYPPFKRFIKITYFGNKEETLKAKNILEEMFTEYSPEIFGGFVSKTKDKYTTNMLIKIDPKKWSLPELSDNSEINKNLLNKLLMLPQPFEILVDPEDLL